MKKEKLKKLKTVLIILFFPLLLHAQEVSNIGVLFDSLKTHPRTKSDELNMEKALLGKRIVTGMLYPKINAYGRYEYASTPSGMLPLSPNELFSMIKDQSIPQPFSKNIFRIGAGVTMPVFAMSIYTAASKAQMLYHSAEAQAFINLQKNEALIVSSNANLQYLNALLSSLEKKKTSLATTGKMIQLQVENGRASKSALLKIQNAINEVSIIENNIRQQREAAISTIRSLTGITLSEPIKMIQTGTYQNGDFKVLEPLRKKIEADKRAWQSERQKLVPSIFLDGNYNHSMAQAYNNNLNINEDYGTVALTLNIPIFTKSQYANIKKTRIEYETSENELARMRLELSSQANELENNLPLLNSSIELYKQSIKDKKELLKIARTSYLSHRITVEDYLKYEDDVVLEKSNLYKTQAKKWQTLMQLAVIYGNNIEEIVK